MKNNTVDQEENLSIEETEDGNGVACQVRRKIEEYLERKRTKDELGEF